MRPPVSASRLFLLLLAGLVTGDFARAAERPAVVASRAQGSMRVDGLLDEPDWQTATPIADFKLILVREGEAPSDSTEVRVLYDAAHVYFGIRCANRGPGAVRASLSLRDEIVNGDDHISIHLDTFRDLHRAYIFGVNPYGVQLDGILDGGEPDFSWDGVWSAETRRHDQGWDAEIAIPVRGLRYPEQGAWGLWIRREINKNAEICTWPLFRQSMPGDIMLQAGDIEGLEGLRGGSAVGAKEYGLELVPYVLGARQENRLFAANEDASTWSSDDLTEVGIDLEASPAPGLTLNGTIHPDFSQIEADALQIDVNQRFPLFFPEKRPFFYEGAELFTTPLNLVYTRRIADPEYGAKVTGAIGRFRVGALIVNDLGGGSMEGVGAEASSDPSGDGFFQIARLGLDVGTHSTVGLLVSRHQLESSPFDLAGPESQFDTGSNTVFAADARVRLAGPLLFTGQAAHATAHFDTTSFAIDSVTFEPIFGGARHELDDWAYRSQLTWDDGIRYLFLFQEGFGPGFRVDTGFLERVDIRKTGLHLEAVVRPENAWLRSWNPIGEWFELRDYDDVLQERRVVAGLEMDFQRQTAAVLDYKRIRERWLSREYDRNLYGLELENRLSRTLSGSLTLAMGEAIFYGPTDAESFLGWQEEVDLAMTLRPSPRLTSELATSRRVFRRRRQGDEVFDLWIAGAKTTYHFTRQLSLRVYPQYDGDGDRIDVDALLGYVVQPGTVLYVGVGGVLDDVGGRRRVSERSVFFKASYRIQT